MQHRGVQSEAQPQDEGIVVALELSDDQLDLIAERVAEKLRRSTSESRTFVDASELATHLKTSRDYIYAHAAELGGVRIGDGPRPRWRFDLARAREVCWADAPTPARPRLRPRRQTLGNAPDLLPIRASSP